MTPKKIIQEIKSLSNKDLAIHHARFFKTGPGEYAEGDKFYGLKVPVVRKIAKKYYQSISLDELDELIKNHYHEIRLVAIVILILKFEKAQEELKEQIYNFYLDHVDYINNWDLVDISAPHIVGTFLYNKNTDKLWELAKTEHLWSQRISILATFYFIRQNDFDLTLALARYFLSHKHDLMHKATGWMLREIGKRDINVLYAFLDEHYKSMPRTMLRYAIEKLPEKKRAYYLKKERF